MRTLISVTNEAACSKSRADTAEVKILAEAVYQLCRIMADMQKEIKQLAKDVRALKDQPRETLVESLDPQLERLAQEAREDSGRKRRRTRAR